MLRVENKLLREKKIKEAVGEGGIPSHQMDLDLNVKLEKGLSSAEETL
jgi:hypothetical protein